MSIILTNTLESSQKTLIQSLVESCRIHEPVVSTFPLEDADFYVYYEEHGLILAAAAFTMEEDDLYECCAFTTPASRHQGLFSELLDCAIDELPEDTGFLFYTNGECADTMAVLDAMKAERILEEYMMEIPLSDFTWTVSEDTPSCHIETKLLDGTTTRIYENTYGKVNISVFSNYYYLYGLEIREEFRGKGHGNALLMEVLADLSTINPLPLRLQVSGENKPALSLYKKTGFQITETLFGYYY